MTNAIVPTATPAMDIIEMTLMKFFFFLERKYLRAMKSGRFKAELFTNLLPKEEFEGL